MVKIKFDGKEVTVKEGQTITEAARDHGVFIPTFCDSKELRPAGLCRACLVEVGMPDRNTGDVRFFPNLMTGCTTTVAAGMEIKVDSSPKAVKARKGVIEFQLINHPLDCPVCDQAGECTLQDRAMETGQLTSRFTDEKVIHKKPIVVKNIKRNYDRCILCQKCVRYADEILKDPVISVANRGDRSEIVFNAEKDINTEFLGNVIDICPVGALTDNIFRFKERIWDLEKIEAESVDCKHNCKASIWMKYGEIKRVTSQLDKDGFIIDKICDKCRFESYDLKKWKIKK